MGIMDLGLYFAGSPRKCSMALGAPHLIASIDLSYTGMALRARFGIFGDQLGGLYVIWVTGVFCTFGLDDVAFLAGFQVTHPAFPV
jgi:hypothetical protein